MLHDQLNQLLDSPVVITPDAASLTKLLTLMDLTSLNASDNKDSIQALCRKAVTSKAHVAAVCVYPEFVEIAAAALKGSPVKVATVANFPLGCDDMQDVLAAIEEAIASGANEIDVVFPYERYLAGERSLAKAFVQACKRICGSHVALKVILETGELRKTTLIADATKLVIEAGADFVKTSTGKAEEGATLLAAAVILLTIKEMDAKAGIKVSGGIREVGDALAYVDLANRVMGAKWVTPQKFRIGASLLIDKLI